MCDRQQRSVAIREQLITYGYAESPVLHSGPVLRETLPGVVAHEGNEIRALATVNIDNSKERPARHVQCYGGLWLDDQWSDSVLDE